MCITDMQGNEAEIVDSKYKNKLSIVWGAVALQNIPIYKSFSCCPHVFASEATGELKHVPAVFQVCLQPASVVHVSIYRSRAPFMSRRTIVRKTSKVY